MGRSFSILVFVFVAFDALVSADTDVLVPNYDNSDHKLKAFEIRRPLVLHCNVTKEGEFELKWKKDGNEVQKVDELENRYTIIEAENKFIIAKTEEYDAGHYSCHLGDDEKKEFHVMAEVAVRTPDNAGVSESEDMKIECVVVGSAPRIHWKIGNLTIHNSMDRYKLEKNDQGVKNTILKVANMTLDDRGNYTCVATNLISDLKISNEAMCTTFVRVKSHLASVWPALGILAEVLILGVVTIFARKADAKLTYE